MAAFDARLGLAAVIHLVQPVWARLEAPETRAELSAHFERDAIPLRPLRDQLHGGALRKRRDETSSPEPRSGKQWPSQK
jgi:hypothetical protein